MLKNETEDARWQEDPFDHGLTGLILRKWLYYATPNKILMTSFAEQEKKILHFMLEAQKTEWLRQALAKRARVKISQYLISNYITKPQSRNLVQNKCAEKWTGTQDPETEPHSYHALIKNAHHFKWRCFKVCIQCRTLPANADILQSIRNGSEISNVSLKRSNC